MKKQHTSPFELPRQFAPNDSEHFFKLDGSEKDIVNLNETGKACKAVYRSEGFYGDLSNIEPGVSIRQPFTRADYDSYRPNESLPLRHKAIIKQCDAAYHKVGLIRNIIDLMSDFGSQGITISHPVQSTQSALQYWFNNRVNGKERSERFLNNLYRAGNVIIRKFTAKVPTKESKKWRSTEAAPDIDYEPDTKYSKNEIPVRYKFLDPQIVDVLSPYIGQLIGEHKYVMRPGITAQFVKNARGEYERELIKKIPADMLAGINKSNPEIPLDPDKTIVYHYKKDDWQVWADPLIYSVLDDVILYQKAKLADMSALDGVISSIRLIKLGNSEKGIYPKPAALDHLHSVLASNGGGGPIDLIWTDDIAIEQIETHIHQFLGSNKYDPILNAIYDGLGIPNTLTSKSSGGGGFTNNALSLKTLVERLEYGRNLLIDFWTKEIRQVQEALGLSKKPAVVRFAYMDLSDETARGTLLTNLADRGYISWETIVERVGESPKVEKLRLKRETKDRAKGRLPNKAGPWHNPQIKEDMEKIALTSGAATPGQLGMKLGEPGPGELTKHQQMMELAKTKVTSTPKGQPNQGRPKTSKDKTKRKTRVPKIKKAVADFITPKYLDQFGVKDSKELCHSEKAKLDLLIAVTAEYLVDHDLEATEENIKESIECQS